MLKKMLVVSLIVVVGSVILYGPDGAKSYANGIKDALKNVVTENTSTRVDVARIDRLIKNEEAKIAKSSKKIGGVANRIEVEREKVAEWESEETDQIAALEVAKAYLQEKKRTYMIDRERTFDEVKNDANARVAYVDTLRQKIGFSQILIIKMEESLAKCKISLENAKIGIVAKKAEFNAMKVREVDVAITAQANQLSNDLAGLSNSLLQPSALNEAMQTYEQKIVSKESGSADGAAVATGININYFPPVGMEILTTVEKIDRILN